MNTKITQVVTLLVTVIGTFGVADYAQGWVGHHAAVFGALAAAAQILHALFPSIFAAPRSTQPPGGSNTVGKAVILLLALLLIPATLKAQTAPTRTSLPNNIYAFGLTGNPNASPAVSGTALYGRLVDTKGTYAIAVLDVVSTTSRPYTITTNPSAGVAQKFYEHGNLKVFVTPDAGLSYSGTATGYSYALGGMITYDLSASYALGFGGRLFKSSIDNSGYQPALSFEFILKQ